MPNDIPDFTQATNITAGSVTIAGGSVSITGTPTVQLAAGATVAISGTPSVSITGTPTVQFAAGQSVSISGTPNVNIASGSVAITGTPNINISSQSVTVNVNQPQTQLGTVALAANGATAVFTTATVPAGTHAIGALCPGTPQQIIVDGVQTSVRYGQFAGVAPNGIPTPGGGGALWMVPITAYDTTYKVTAVNSNPGNATTVYAVAVLDTEVVFPYPQPAQPTTPTTTDLIKINGNPVSGGGAAVNTGQLPVSFPLPRAQSGMLVANFNVVLAPGATSVLQAAVAGKTPYVWGCNFIANSATSAEILVESTAGAATVVHENTSVTHYADHPLYGVGMTISQGIRLRNSAGAGSPAISGEVIYELI